MMKRWIAAWVGTPVLAIINGGVRETLYADAVGDEAAHAISTGTLLALLGGYMWLLQRRWPLEGRREALTVGGVWAGLAIAFEFGLGHGVEGDSWSTPLANYDVTAGKIWILVPAALIVGPELVRRLSVSSQASVGPTPRLGGRGVLRVPRLWGRVLGRAADGRGLRP